MKRLAIILLIIMMSLTIASCSKGEVIGVGNENLIFAAERLLNWRVMSDYETEVGKTTIFTDQEEYDEFTQKYFSEVKAENHDFEKYDILIINLSHITTPKNPMYTIDNILKKKDKCELTLRTIGSVSFDDYTSDHTFVYVGYIKIPKGKIPEGYDIEFKIE